jgi:hypothetical protein
MNLASELVPHGEIQLMGDGVWIIEGIHGVFVEIVGWLGWISGYCYL